VTYASFPEPSPNGQMRLGRDYEEDAAGDVWFNHHYPDGSFAVGDLDGWDDLDFVTPIDTVGGRDGGLSGPPSIAPRVTQVSALVTAPTAALADRLVARIRRVLLPAGSNTPRLPIVWEQFDHGAGRRLALVVRPTGKFRAERVPGRAEGGEARVVQIGLTAVNPTWKLSSGPLDSEQATLLNPALVGGRTYDVTYPWNYGSAVDPGGQLVAVNTGDRDAAPVFTIAGPLGDYVIITNVTTGQEFAVLATPGAGETVVIDLMRGGIVTPGNTRIVGRPFTLAPGANTIRWRTASGTYYPGATLTIEWRSTYS
jgi:hypothetical protein